MNKPEITEFYSTNHTFWNHYYLYLFIYSVIRQSFSFQNNPKDLDPSYKMDLDFWDCLGRVKLVLLQNFVGLI